MGDIKIDRAVIEVNGACNFDCTMCPQDKRVGGRHKGFLAKMNLMEFEDNLRDCKQHGMRVVNLDGSGEATLNRNLSMYIALVKKYDCQAVIFSNGFKMHGQFMKDCVDAGLDFFRFSFVGSNPEKYQEWMNNTRGSSYHIIKKNIEEMMAYVKETGSTCVVETYHLITDNANIDAELDEYKALVEELGCKTEIWKMHNWSGAYDIGDNKREGTTKTCGRPFSPDVVIRAGGIDGGRGAVHPCCQVLGRDEEAVMGHTSHNTIEEIIRGPEYSALRESHRTGEYTDYCGDCDFLLDDPETLVYTNNNRATQKMIGTDFNLEDYRNGGV
jgi:MoaA/NifB/PqqE/SkfB family radical SAM enzyme|tara:strand:- start:1879 stop:2862 length:984 start_codon:yes stop_codon:yes gene_type:complete